LTDKAAVAYRDKRQVLWAIRGVGFLGGISALSAGLYYNSRLGGVEAAEQKIIDENKASGNTADASLFAERFRDQSKRYERLSSYRNMCYTAGVLLAAGVGVTWLF
jgi:hypothetical protein